MKIFAISGSVIGIPTIQELIKAKLLSGIGIPEGNNQHLTQLAQMAKAARLPLVVLKKKNLKKDLEKVLDSQKPAVVFVLTFPYKIPAQVLNIPKFGFLNYHCAQLPQYRGPQPNFWEIKNQEHFSAVTVHLMDADFDTGPIVYQERVPIHTHFTFGMLKVSLSYMAIKATQMVLMQLQMGMLNKTVQNTAHANYLPKPKWNDFVIDWRNSSSSQIRALIRATNPDYQGAITMCNGIGMRVLAASMSDITPQANAKGGQIIAMDASKGLCVACTDGKAIKLDIVSLEEGTMLGHDLAKIGFAVGNSFQDAKR